MNTTRLSTLASNCAALVFIIADLVLGFIAIGGVWDFFKDDVIWKSFETLGIVAFATVLILIATKYFEQGNITTPWPIFSSIRRVTVVSLAVSAALLAFTGVLAVWDVLDSTIAGKSIASLVILGFVSLLLIATSLDRENNLFFKQKIGFGRAAGFAALALVVLYFLRYMFWY